MQYKNLLSSLVFAEIVSVTLHSHKRGDSWKTDKGEYKYYYGHARILGGKVICGKKNQTILFQLTKHIKKSIQIGPMKWNVVFPNKKKNLVREKDIIFGQLLKQNESENRLRFAWWSINGKPVYELHRLLRYKGRSKHLGAMKIHQELLVESRPCLFKCADCGLFMPQGTWSSNSCEVCGGMEQEFIDQCMPGSKTYSQDLWVMYLLYGKHNIAELLDIQSGNRSHRRSAFNKQTLTLSSSPLRFVFICSWFAGDISLYDNFVSEARHKMKKYKVVDKIQQTFKDLLTEKLSREALAQLILESSSD